MAKSERIARQSAHPRGLFGHVVARVMAFDSAAVNRRAVERLAPEPGERILELGCGRPGGELMLVFRERDAAALAALPASVYTLRSAEDVRALAAAGFGAIRSEVDGGYAFVRASR
jgi:cyclopropane fatty-acyl-phospholipid synthase-like methyltransferase